MRASDDAENLWRAARDLNRAAAAVMPDAAALSPLIFMTDPDRTPHPWTTAARLPAGAAVIFRAFGRRDALETGRRLRQACDAAGVRLLVGLDADLAAAIGADGLHLPQRALAHGPSIRRDHPGWLLTGAAHDADSLADAACAGLDAAILSPVFAPGGVSSGRPLGVEGFARLARAAALPVLALGGITAANAHTITVAGGLCAVEGIRQAFDDAHDA